MPRIPALTIDFKHANSWGIRDGHSEIDVSPAKLLHAAVTVGHRNLQGLGAILTSEDLAVEINMKRANLEAAVRIQEFLQGNGMSTASRLVPRSGNDIARAPSDKGLLSYQLGMTMATAWVREVLRVPWLLHLDVYGEALGIPGIQGEKPDLIGRHPDGRWIVVEAKGLKRKPSRESQSDAKNQLKSVNNINGHTPALKLAIFSFFATDSLANCRPKPLVINLWVVDPPPEGDAFDPFELSSLTPSLFWKLYYAPWTRLLDRPDLLQADDTLLWFQELGSRMRIGILPEIARAIESQDYESIPKVVALAAEKRPNLAKVPGWVGDGIVVESPPDWLAE